MDDQRGAATKRKPESMPVMREWSRQLHAYLPALCVPWAMLEPHDAQARKNHAGQSLHRLYERHGVGACEAIAILEDRPWKGMVPDESHAALSGMIARWMEEHPSAVPVSSAVAQVQQVPEGEGEVGK